MKTILNYIVAITAISALTLSLYGLLGKKKIAYVDNIYIFENSKMKADLYKKLEEDQKVRKAILDSLENEIKTIVAGKPFSEKDPAYLYAKSLEEKYYQKQEKFTQELKTIADDVNRKIWNHINENIVQYSKENKFDYLFGANGQGSIMYAGEPENISEKIMEFINDKYEDK
jgi:Skp family chaperone for outer membrane proteins